MANFLDPVDVATPAGTEERIQGDDRLREFKRAVDERIRREHSLPAAAGSGSARHKFLFGADAARPTDPATGTIFLNTTQGTLDYWSGAAWVRLNGVWPNAGQVTFGGVQALTTSPVLITNMSIAPAEDGHYLILPSWSVEITPDGAHSLARGGIYKNGVLVYTAIQSFITSDASHTMTVQHGGEPRIESLVSGDTIELRGHKITAGPVINIALARMCIVKVRVT